MSISSGICPERMARGQVGRFPDGAKARQLLHRLLLVSDGLTLYRGGDELALGRCYCGIHLARKGGPGRSAYGLRCRGLDDSWGRSVVRADAVGWDATRDQPRDGN